MVTLRTPPDRLPYTGDDEADRLIATDPLALLVGFALDQQITVQKAFAGPRDLRDRVGGLDARAIAAMPPERLAEVFAERPALHRFPGSMAAKVQALCAAVAADYDGEAARIWTTAADGRELAARLKALPGFGEMKAASVLAVLAKRFGLDLAGLDALLPSHPTLGDVDSPEALAAYQAGKRAHKAELKAAKSAGA